MKIPSLDFLLPSSGILSLFLASLLYRRAPGPDEAHSLSVISATFFYFWAYACSQYSWGRICLNRRGKLWESFFMGSVLFSLIPACIGFFPVVGASCFALWLLILGFSPLLLLWMVRREIVVGKELRLEKHQIFLIFPCLWLLIGAASPHPFWDGLWYHLTSSRIWYEAGKVHLPPFFPVALKAGLWDYHFLWGQILLGGPVGGGLIPAQLFGQWASLATGFFSLLILLEEKEFWGLGVWASIAGWIGTELFFEVEFAKNDWAAIFWSLAAICFLFRGKNRLGNLAMGWAFAAKYTSGFFLAPIFLFRAKGAPLKESFKGLLFALVAAFPVLLRNFLLTKNPVFPAFHSFWGSEALGPTWAAISIYEPGSNSLAAVLEKLGSLARESSVVLGIALVPFAGFPAKARQLVWISVFALFLFLVGSGMKAEWRLAGAALLLAGAYGAQAVFSIADRFAKKHSGIACVVVFLLVCFFAPWDRGAWNRLKMDPAERIRQHVSGAAMAWVRLNAPGASAATLQEQRIYYLFPNVPRRVFDDPQLDRELAKAQGVESATAILRAAGIRYLVLSAEFLDKYYDKKICAWFYELSEKNPQAVVFRSDWSRVLDLDFFR